MNNNYLFSILIPIIFCSCGNEESINLELNKNSNSVAKSEMYKTIDDKKFIDSLKKLVLIKGDRTAYRELYIVFAKDLRHGEILLYSMQMAHKYNYPQAYDCIYSTFVEKENSNDLSSLDEQTRNLATYYLLRAYELGVDEKYILEKEFGKGATIPKSSVYLEKMKLYDSKLIN